MDMIAPASGVILLAEPFMKDPSFMRTAVLLCRHNDEEGTFGFVLNKPADVCLSDIMNDFEDFDLPVYNGGPVASDTLHYLHQYPEYFPDAVEVAPGVWWGGDFTEFKRLLKAGLLEESKLRFLLGCSGWIVGQLDDEMRENSWLTVQADGKFVFETEATQLWNEGLTRLGGKYKMMIHFPADPQLN